MPGPVERSEVGLDRRTLGPFFEVVDVAAFGADLAGRAEAGRVRRTHVGDLFGGGPVGLMPAVDHPTAAGAVPVVNDEQPQPGLVVRDHPGDVLAWDQPGVGNFTGEVVEASPPAAPAPRRRTPAGSHRSSS